MFNPTAKTKKAEILLAIFLPLSPQRLMMREVLEKKI